MKQSAVLVSSAIVLTTFALFQTPAAPDSCERYESEQRAKEIAERSQRALLIPTPTMFSHAWVGCGSVCRVVVGPPRR